VKVCTTCGTEYPDDQSFCPADGSALRSTSAGADLVGTILADRYRILEKLGEGGMGAVYLAEHVKMGRMSAIKVISKSLAQDPDAIARFNREAANAARINHPNVCAIYDFGETADGIIYLAMELIEGEALTEIVNREGALPPKRAAEITRQAAEALEAAHEFGIVHRDLKPDNIMIAKTRDGSDLAKVVDFGIAKAAGGDEKQKVTKTGLVVGTPEYMSPEQLSGDAVDGRSDIYSLGLVCFRMLTGTLPFEADTAQEIMIKRLTDEPLALGAAAPGRTFPAALQQVMNRALQRMPADRYASAARFGEDIANAVAGMADAEAPVDPSGTTQLMDTSDATEAVPATRISSQSHSAPTPDTPMPTAVAEEKKRKVPTLAIAAAVGAIALGGGGVAVLMSGNGGVDSTGQMAQNPVTRDTESDSGAGEGSRSEGTRTSPNQQRGAPTSTTNPPQDSGPEMTSTRTEDTAMTAPAPANPAWMTLPAGNHLGDLLAALFDEDDAGRAAIRDTAIFYYDAAGISDQDKATAAYVAASAYRDLGDRSNALDWVHKAIQLNPEDRSAQILLQALERGGNP
jgi:serine/threonine protein kinase